MSASIPRTSLPSRVFWYVLSTISNAVSQLWLRPTQYEPVVERVRVPLAGLPAALDGLTIAHMSDFHAGRAVHAHSIRRAAALTMALKPDLIALTGDFVHRHLDPMPACADALSILRAPLGVHAVLGNHDYWRDAHVVERHLRRVGIAPMHNESRRIGAGARAFYIIGVDDVRFRRADFDRAARDVPAGAVSIVLVHEPDFADHIPPGPVLQLSGHSHGGQVRMPRFGAVLLPSLGKKYPAGLKRAPHGMWVYTTRGVGVAMPPVRYNCPPEVTLLTLSRS